MGEGEEDRVDFQTYCRSSDDILDLWNELRLRCRRSPEEACAPSSILLSMTLMAAIRADAEQRPERSAVTQISPSGREMGIHLHQP